MRRLTKKLTAIAVAAAMVMGTAAMPVSAASKGAPRIEDVEYKSKGVVEVDFVGNVKYKNVKITAKDNKGKKYSVSVVNRDKDDIKFKIKKFKKNRTYTFNIKGVKKWKADKYRTIKGKVRIPAEKKVNPAPNQDQSQNQDRNQNKDQNLIGLEKARAIALEDAGMNAADVTFVQAKEDYDDGRLVYEVDFCGNGAEYEYDIDARTGEILKRDIEAGASPASDTDIGRDQAVQVALTDAGLAASSTRYINVQQDYENGRLVYEVEFFSGGFEYEYEIASDGSILKKDVEYDD